MSFKVNNKISGIDDRLRILFTPLCQSVKAKFVI